MLSSDIRKSAPFFTKDSKSLWVAGTGIQRNVLLRIAPKTGSIVQVQEVDAATGTDPSCDVNGIAAFKEDEIAVASERGVHVGKKQILKLKSGTIARVREGPNSSVVVATRDEIVLLKPNLEQRSIPLTHQKILTTYKQFVIGASESVFQVWNEQWDETLEFQHTTNITCMAAGSDILAIGDKRGVITLWDVFKTMGKRARKRAHVGKNHWHANEVTAMAFMGKSLCSGGMEGVLRVWHTADNQFQTIPRLGPAFLHITTSPDERWIGCTLVNNALIVIDSGDWIPKWIFNPIVQPGPSVDKLSPMKNLIVSNQMVQSSKTQFCIGGDQSITFFKNVPWKALHVPLWERNYIYENEHPMILSCLTFAMEGKVMVTCEKMGILPDGKILLSRQVMKFWRYNEKMDTYEVESLVYDPHPGICTQLLAHPHEPIIYSFCTDGVIKTWEEDHETDKIWKPATESQWREKEILRSAINSDGSMLALVYNNDILIWDTENRCALKHWNTSELCNDINFIQSWGSSVWRIITQSGNILTIWNPQRATVVQKIRMEDKRDAKVMAVNPSCTRIAVVDKKNCILIYKVEPCTSDKSDDAPVLVEERRIGEKSKDIAKICWLDDDRLALIGAAVEIVSATGQEMPSVKMEPTMEEVVEAPMMTSDVTSKRKNKILLPTAPQIKELLNEHILPQRTPSHMLPSGKFLVQQYFQLFGQKQKGNEIIGNNMAPDRWSPNYDKENRIESEQELGVICNEPGPLISIDFMDKIFNGDFPEY